MYNISVFGRAEREIWQMEKYCSRLNEFPRFGMPRGCHAEYCRQCLAETACLLELSADILIVKLETSNAAKPDEFLR